MLKPQLIRQLRHRLHLTQATLGEAIGQSQPYISDLERGVRTVLAVATLDRLAQALGVPMETLLTLPGMMCEHQPLNALPQRLRPGGQESRST